MTGMGHVRNYVARSATAQPRLMALESAAWAGTTLRWRVFAAISTPDFVAVALFCAIGLLATLNLMLAVPDAALM